ncbi:hypothetical protein P3T76_001951 [Phytophthora citrophthora]|uniref:Uncharacterized protein n=1 Tax=Phytophthora citrophthora TaxID=4793 RepID=A0AAD9GYG2_9STRA|nr:hypothetical protein P3T76_001951 [Phytophthora citrophthora]
MERAFDSTYTAHPLDSRFVSAALDFLLNCGPDMTLEQVRVVDQIIGKAVSKTKELLLLRYHSEDNSNTEEIQQEGDDDRLGDLLDIAFQRAASHLDRTEKHSSDGHQVSQRCSQVIDALCAISTKDGEPMDQEILWQELLCHCWDETAAGLALELLLLRAQMDVDGDSDNWMGATATLQVVSSLYAQFPVTLKRFSMDQVSVLVSTLIDEGPAYPFTPRMQLQLELLRYLAAVDFLDNSDDLDTAQWLDDYFPECFVCCGVALQLLDDWKQEDGVGMLRMMDMCLLVFKTVLGTFATKREDFYTLLKILTPTITAALTRLTSRPAIPNEPTARKISDSCLETSLYLLVKVAPVIEEDECDALMTIFERLLVPIPASDFSTRPVLLSGCFDAIHQILVHSSIAEMMEPPLIKLLEDGDLQVLYVQYTSRQDRSVDSSSNSSHSGSDEDIETEKAVPIACLLSGMGLDDTKDSDELAIQDSDEISTCTCSGASVLRPDAPQWFGEEDSDDDTNEMESEVSSLLPDTVDDDTTSGIVCIASTTTMPQWFDDTDGEDEAGIDLP